jgi:hypothetical protein
VRHRSFRAATIDFAQRFFVQVWHDDCPQGENQPFSFFE